jgi:multidrug efflux pump subunit AcrB|tara:strand:+ start:103 stop:234 length:132 start_codon:yes stop_codon:yes gene_type:complete
MLKEILLKLAMPLTLMTFCLVVSLAPLYLVGGMMTRSMIQKTN